MKKKTVCWIVIIVLIIAGIFGYNRYMHGNLKIDRELVSDENLNLLADNWEKLDIYDPIPTDGTDWVYLMCKGGNDDIFAQLWVNTGDPSAPNPFLDNMATYSRTSLMDILNDPSSYGLNSLHKSFNQIFISNSRLAILFWEFEGKANADNFETWFSEQLELAQS